jgi:hypothetical protein
VVLSDGNVNFCCFSSAIVGNVNQQPFLEVWNGTIMRRIRQTLSEQRFPPECQSTSCPLYRGDKLSYLVERMAGPHRFEVAGTHDPHLAVRTGLQGSQLALRRGTIRPGEADTLTITLRYEGAPLRADLFVGVRFPEGHIQFLPRRESYAVPFIAGLALREDSAPEPPLFQLAFGPWPDPGAYRVTVALFEADSNPNLLSNCYWAESRGFTVAAE